MQSLMAGWRVSLRRTRADWPIVVAAWLTMLLATMLIAAGPIYSSAVSVAGLRQMLAEAPIEAGNVRVSAGVPLRAIGTVDAAITAELQRAVGSMPSEIARAGTGSSFALPGQAEVRDLAVAGFAEGVEGHATLVAGTWPGQAQTPADASVPLIVSEPVADQLQLTVGESLELVSRLDEDLVLNATIAGVFRIDDPGDPFWWADQRAIDGVTETDQYRTFGPFLLSRADLLNRASVNSASLSWRVLPNFEQIATDDINALRSRVIALPDRLRQVAGEHNPNVQTELPHTLSLAAQQMLVSRTGMLLVMAQLAILGGYAILLTAGLLIDHRRLETALLRSRGAGPGHVASLALLEGLFLAVPAALLGPWLAIVALSLFELVGPLAQVGLTVPLRVTSDAYLAAGIAGAACVALLGLPALLSARSSTAEERSLSREETRPLAQRLGIDFALLVVAAIAMWQLRLYGGPLTRTLQGSVGPDPLLIAAPALGLLLGAVIATRLLPRLAETAQRIFARGKGLVGALGSFQLARRPLRYTRSALMLMLAMSIGVFAVSYATTWTESQRSQADHQVGADAIVTPSRSARALPPWSLYEAYSAVTGVEEASPVERYEIALAGSVGGTVLALDAAAIPDITRIRSDQSTASLADLLAPLAAARPTVELIDLPDGTTELTVTPTIDIRGLDRYVLDPVTDDFVRQVEDPAAFDEDASVSLSVAVRDAHGVIHRIAAPPVSPASARAGIGVPITTVTRRAQDAPLPPDGPLALASIDLSIVMPQDLVVTDASLAIGRVATATPADAEAVTLDLGAPESWRMAWQDSTRVPLGLAPAEGEGLGIRIGDDDGGSGAPNEMATDGVRPVTISMQPATLSALAVDEIPVLVSRQTLEATALQPNERLPVDLAGAQRQLRIVGVVDSFPTTDSASPLIVADLPTLALLRIQEAHDLRSRSGSVTDTRQPDEWWLDLAAAGSSIDSEAAALADEVSRTLASPLFGSVNVTTLAGRLRGLLSDPVAVGIIGALGLGAIAAALFALVGLAVAASVSARQRQNEFALMRALGLSRRQLSGWLWLENGSLAVVSVLVGTALGALISWVVLPSVTMTGDGRPPTPPVIVTMPLPTIALLGLVAAIATAIVVAVMAAVLRRTGIGNVLRASEE
jgi:hypothetical protein